MAKTELQPTGADSNITSNQGVKPETADTVQPQADVSVLKQQVEELSEQVKKVQSAKDAEIAKIHRLYQERMNAVQARAKREIETVADVLPEEAKQAYLERKQAQELNELRAEKARQEAANYLVEQFGVPHEVLKDADSPEAMSAAAFTWMKRRLDEVTAPPSKEELARKEAEEAKRSGAVDTTVSRGTSAPGAVVANMDMSALQEAARKGGREGRAARIEYLKALNSKASAKVKV